MSIQHTKIVTLFDHRKIIFLFLGSNMLWIYIATLIPSTLPPFLIGFMIGAWLRFAIDSKTEKSLINSEPRPATWYLFAIVILPFWPLVRFANYLYHFGARQ